MAAVLHGNTQNTLERPKSLIIDIHGHIRTEGVDDEVRKFVPAMSLDSIKYASPLTRELNKNRERTETRSLWAPANASKIWTKCA